jgi:moderate conductance mechanosensitive channel
MSFLHAILRLLPALCVALLLAMGGARAQTQTATVSAAELEKLVGTLENDAERQRFVEQLKALIEAERRVAPAEPAIPDRVAARFLGSLSEQVAEFGAGILRAAAFIADAPNLLRWIRQQAESEWSRQRLTEIFGKLALVLLGGWTAEWLVIWALARARRRLETSEIGEGWARAPYIVLYALIALVPILVFALVAFAILGAVSPTRTAALVATALINANLIARAINLAAATILAPPIGRLRLVPLTDETANYLYIWARRLTNIAVYGYFAANAALLIGMPNSGYIFILKLLGIILSLLLIILVLQNRANLAQAILGHGSPGLLRRRFAELWHVLALLYIFTVCFIWLVRPDGGFEFVARATWQTVVVVFGAWAITNILRRLVALAFRLTDDVRRRFPTLEVRANQYLHIVNVVIVVAAYGFAALAVFQAWGFASLEWLTTPVGRRVGGSLVSIGITVVAALVTWEFVNALLDRYLTRAIGGGYSELRRAARIRTLMPLLQNVLLSVLAVFVGLIVLSEIGLNIAPLLAGAGVVGIAVGFGAQALMKDLFGGISIIIEDSIAVGDIVGIGDKGGVVEWMSLRVMRLRDFDGTVHTIPFGEVQTISNRTKDFAFAVFQIAVSRGSDIEHVQRVVREVGATMRADPEFGAMILEDIELHGIDRFDESAMIVLARFKVLPAKQWTITRKFNILLKQAFDCEGIEIPFPQRTVRIIDDRREPPEPGATAAAP